MKTIRIDLGKVRLVINLDKAYRRLIEYGIASTPEEATRLLRRFLHYLLLDAKENPTRLMNMSSSAVFEDCVHYIGLWIQDIDRVLDSEYRRRMYSYCRELAEKYVEIY